MGNLKFSEQDVEALYERAVAHNGNLSATARDAGLNRGCVYRLLKKRGYLARLREVCGSSVSSNLRYKCVSSNKEKLDVRPTTIGLAVEYIGTKITTEEELLKDAGIDMELYEIERCVVNNWEVAGAKKHQDEDDSVWKTGLRQVKITLRRKRNDLIVVERILARLEEASPMMLPIKYPKSKKGTPRRALEVSIMDPHYGMMCFQGDSDHNWDLEKCEELCMWSIDTLLEDAEKYGPFEEIVFPFGNDFLHHDNLEHTTTRGTNQPEGLSYLYVYERAIRLAVTMIERLAEVAPVKVIQVSGNHDQVSAFTLGHVLNAYYRNDPNVSVDVSPSPYKFWRFGTNLLGLDHGHHVKPPRLAALMAHECKDVWAETTFREWHLGDQHRKGSAKPITMEEQGVSVEYLPALTPPNAWHRLKAFNWQQRGAMAFIWDADKGPQARLQVNLDSYTGKPTGM
jgi:hypothetical protein|tara:strand:- start:6189 stop:7553 length:1365 start_codon:yes stop_codon:yes gene_type:complete